MYPHAACEHTPYESGLTGDPGANWGDFYIAPDGTVTRFVVDPAGAADQTLHKDGPAGMTIYGRHRGDAL
jgi:hypothetical protein